MVTTKYILRILFIFIIFSCLSCEAMIDALTDLEECEGYDFSTCNTEQPFRAYLIIDLTINEQNQEVPLIIYRGKFEDADTFALDTATHTPWEEVYVPLNQFYTVAAKYHSGNKTIIAISGDKITKNSSKVCDSTCWEIYGGEIDVRLKFEK